MKRMFRASVVSAVLLFAVFATAGAEAPNCFIYCDNGSVWLGHTSTGAACCANFQSFCGGEGVAYWRSPSGAVLYCAISHH